MVTAAMVIGLSLGFLVLAKDGKVIDTVLFSLSVCRWNQQPHYPNKWRYHGHIGNCQSALEQMV